jgi:hypothetical protein
MSEMGQKNGNTHGEQMTSALPPATDIDIRVDSLGTSGVPETVLIESSGLSRSEALMGD